MGTDPAAGHCVVCNTEAIWIVADRLPGSPVLGEGRGAGRPNYDREPGTSDHVFQLNQQLSDTIDIRRSRIGRINSNPVLRIDEISTSIGVELPHRFQTQNGQRHLPNAKCHSSPPPKHPKSLPRCIGHLDRSNQMKVRVTFRCLGPSRQRNVALPATLGPDSGIG